MIQTRKAKHMRALLLRTVYNLAAFANANAGSKLSICVTAQAAPLANAAAYAALTYVEIKFIGSHGEAGTKTNVLTYDTWGNQVIQKAKGMSDAGSPELEVARDMSDAGQDAIRTAALGNLNFAFKMERNDKITVGGTNTIIYNRGLVLGPARPWGRNEDFDVEVFTLAFQDLETIVDPT